MNRNKNLVMTIVLMLLVISIGTFAWLSYQTNKTALFLSVGNKRDMIVTLSPYQINSTLVPQLNYSSNTYTSISATNNGTTSREFNLFYVINSIDEDLMSSDFKYSIEISTDGGSTYEHYITGDFRNADTSESFYILEEESVPGNTTYKYKVYIWIDGSTNQNNIESATFIGELRADILSSGNIIVDIPEGLIPVSIANDGTVTVMSPDDPEWCNYDNKIWCNGVLVAHTGDDDEPGAGPMNYIPGTKSNTPKTIDYTPGTELSLSDILAFFVYIPRYSYAIPEAGTCGSIVGVNPEDYPMCYSYSHDMNSQDTELLRAFIAEDSGMNSGDIDLCIQNEDEWEGCFDWYLERYNENNDPDITVTYGLVSNRSYNGARTIDIVFENNSVPKSTGTAVGSSYRTHPAFTFGSEELNGIWVGKFETTYGYDEIGLTILPGTSIAMSNVNNEFFGSIYFAGAESIENDGSIVFYGNDSYGLTSSTDSHMMKNSEWGAVAYLANSIYGIDSEIEANGNYYMTACDINGDFIFGLLDDYPQTTTGNISGVFDMVGGTSEYVMSSYYDEYSYFEDEWEVPLDTKYYDSYMSDIFIGDDQDNIIYCTINNCGGHALYETSGWYNSYAYFVSYDFPFFIRGGYDSNLSIFSANSGNAWSNDNSFRVILVNTSLNSLPGEEPGPDN